MVRVARLVVVLVLMAVSNSGCQSQQQKISEPPRVTLGWKKVDAQSIRMPQYELPRLLNEVGQESRTGRAALNGKPGSPVLINFWASYCGPCVKELPLLQRLADSGDAIVYGVSRDVRQRFAKEMLDDREISYANWIDSEGRYMAKLRGLIPVLAIPSSLLVVDGKIVYTHVGRFDSWEELHEHLPKHSGGGVRRS